MQIEMRGIDKSFGGNAVLKNAGFSTVETFDGFSFNKPTKRSERVLFVAQQTAKRHVFDKFLTKKQKNSKKYVFFC